MPKPAPPKSLKGQALERWTAVAPKLEARGPVDVDTLSTYCQVWARWREAEDGLAKSGQLVRTRSGGVGPNPLIAMSNQAGTQVRALEKRLGLDREEHAGAEPMSLRTYAKRVGVSAEAVSKAIKSGRLVRSVVRVGKAPKIADPELADREWAENTDLSEAPDYIKARAAAMGIRSKQEPGDDARVALATSAAREREARANLTELEYLTKAGELVSAKDVESAWIEMVTQMRTAMLGVVSKVRQQHPDAPRAVLATADEEIRRALEGLAPKVEKGAAA